MRRALFFSILFAVLFAAIPSSALLVKTRVGLMSLETEPTLERALGNLADRAIVILPQLESDLGLHATERFRMLLVPATTPRDSEILALDRAAPPWAAGYYAPSLRTGAIRIAQASRYPYGTLESVLAHETTHVLLHDRFGERLPGWFDEGVSTWEGRRWTLEDAMIVTTSLLTSDLPRLASLDRDFHSANGDPALAYAASFAFVSWSVRHHGDSLIRDVLREARTRPFEEAWAAASGTKLADDEQRWRRESLFRYRWVPVITASSTLWLGITGLALAAGVRRRARDRRLRERWAEEEREEPVPEPIMIDEGTGEESDPIK